MNTSYKWGHKHNVYKAPPPGGMDQYLLLFMAEYFTVWAYQNLFIRSSTETMSYFLKLSQIGGETVPSD